jgi:hypothetical protein
MEGIDEMMDVFVQMRKEALFDRELPINRSP